MAKGGRDSQGEGVWVPPYIAYATGQGMIFYLSVLSSDYVLNRVYNFV